MRDLAGISMLVTGVNELRRSCCSSKHNGAPDRQKRVREEDEPTSPEKRNKERVQQDKETCREREKSS